MDLSINGQPIKVSKRLARIICLVVQYAEQIDNTAQGSLELHFGPSGQIKPKLHMELGAEGLDIPVN